MAEGRLNPNRGVNVTKNERQSRYWQVGLKLILATTLPCLALGPSRGWTEVPAGGDIVPDFPVLFTVGTDASCSHTDLDAAIAESLLFGPAQHEIRIAKNYDHPVSSTVTNQSLIFSGGYAACDAAEPSGRTVLVGADNGSSMFDVLANASGAFLVTFHNLTLSQNSSDRGGAIAVAGQGLTVRLENVQVVDNEAIQAGGGLFVDSGSHLILTDNSEIFRNRAIDGGEIYCENDSSVDFLDGAIGFNQATSPDRTVYNHGGGIFASNCDVLVRAGGTFRGLFANRADYGGGIHAENGSFIHLVGDEGHPASVEGNFQGGGISAVGSDVVTVVFARNARINHNTGNGVSLFSGSALSADRTPECHTADRCSQISYNSLDGVVAVGGAGSVALAQTFVEGNAFSGIRGIGALDVSISLTGSIVANNGESAIEGSSGGLFIDQSTLVGGDRQMPLIQGIALETKMRNSILWRRASDSAEVETFPTADLGPAELDCVLLDTIDGAPADVSRNRIFELDPEFSDFEGGDYHLTSGSPAIDRCGTLGLNQIGDIDGEARGFEIDGIGDPGLPDDIGADEYRSEVIVVVEKKVFADGFESGDLSLWQ